MTEQTPPNTQDTLTRPLRLRRLKPLHVLSVLGLMGCVLVAASAGLFAYLYQMSLTTPATVVVGGEPRLVNTRADTVADMLADMGITIREGDQLSVAPDAPVDDNMVITLQRARTVTLTIDDETRTIRTLLANPAEILARAGVTLNADDRVLLDGTRADPQALAEWQIPVNQIQIRRAVNVTITEGDRTVTVRTSGQTVGDALYEAGVSLYLADEVTPDLNTPITAEMQITIQRSVPITIVADGVTLETRAQGETVGDVLAQAGITLMGLDYTIPGEDVALRPGMTVRVMRVREEVISEREIIPFESVNQAEPSLELDQIRLVQPGANGLRRTDIRVRYENGIAVDRTEEATVTVQEPQDRVVAYGTGVVVRTIQTEQGPREYWRKLRLYATSYHPAALGGDNITATGRILTKGIVGIDPSLIPYGTELYVPGYGVGVAADTGAPRDTTRWIDLGYDDENFEIWARYVDVYILAPVPDDIQYILPD